MKKVSAFILNTIFFIIIVLVAITVATLALTKKINEYKMENAKGITATVVKQEVPVLSFSKGIVKKIHVKVGQQVKKGDLLVEVEDPILQGEVNVLGSFKDNVSAQTQAKVAAAQLNNLNIKAPATGVVSDVSINEGTPINELNKVLTIYSNDNIRLLAYVSDAQYQEIQQKALVDVYSDRLNQDFLVKPESLNPDEKQTNNEKLIGLYFTFKNASDSTSLLNNEDVEVRLTNNQANISKPIDVFVNFWNNIIGKDQTK